MDLHKECRMILDKLTNSRLYLPLHPAFAAAFDFLFRPDLPSLPPGRHEIMGQRVFAIIAHDAGKGHDRARLEFHRRYIDIQYVVSGVEQIGWRELSACAGCHRSAVLGGPVPVCATTGAPNNGVPAAPDAFDDAKDIGFCDDRPQTWLTLSPNHFAILYPHDAHAPLAGHGPVHKVVVKVMI
jgi:beta-galactosidase beta subunit